MSILNSISIYLIPSIVLIIVVTGMYNNVKVYDAFLEGVTEGLQIVIKILPPLIGLLVAVGVFRESGALEFFINIIKPVAMLLGIPTEVIPMALLRPLSGSGSLALLSDMLAIYGPDSYIGFLASTMMGSTETIFYTLSVYFGTLGIKKVRFTLVCALMADAFGILCSVFICNYLFKN